MNVVWFSWKDINHPAGGGAENLSWHMMQSLVADGHKVRHITARYEGSSEHEVVEGVETFRTGSRFGVYPKARNLFKKQMADWPDLIVDEMNTIPFMSAFYSRKKSVLLAYQLAREVWFYQMPFPISFVGYCLEPFYLFALSRRYKTILTESESTRQDMTHYGFKKENIHVFRAGNDIEPIKALGKKTAPESILILGAMRPMKRTLSAVKSFEYARDANPKLSLKIAGDTTGSYAEKVLSYISKSRHQAAITVLGRVSNQEKLQVMREAGMILVTSIKEGWGLIVTEANSQGTPAIVYDVDGLRDSVKDGKTGVLVKTGDERAMGAAINKLVTDSKLYAKLREAAWADSKQFTYTNGYSDFVSATGIGPGSRNEAG